MRKHTLLLKDAQSERGQVCDLVAQAAHLQLHAHMSVQAREHSVKLEKIQVDAICLGKLKLPLKAEVRQSVFGDVAVQPLLRLQHEVRSVPGHTGSEAAGQEAENCAAHPEPTHEVDPAVGGLPDGGGCD